MLLLPLSMGLGGRADAAIMQELSRNAVPI